MKALKTACGNNIIIPIEAIDRIGPWLSAALDDPNVCKEMKDDINYWMEATDCD